MLVESFRIGTATFILLWIVRHCGSNWSRVLKNTERWRVLLKQD